jgi:hypothetical protein
VALTIGAGMLAVGVSGCWMAALQLAPVALSAAGGVGKGAVALASRDHSDPEDADDFPRGQKCDDLEVEAPVMVQMLVGTGGEAKWRELSISQGMEAEQRWITAPTQETDASGWRAVSNLASLDFQPPIQTSLTPGALVYLAYAPSDPKDLEERNELSGLGFNFGTELGTFHSDGRVYRYALLKELPCFPPPAH